MQSLIESLFEQKPAAYTADDRELFTQFLVALTEGRIRAAEPDPAAASGWPISASSSTGSRQPNGAEPSCSPMSSGCWRNTQTALPTCPRPR